jgi:hypothetical protein
VYAYAKVEWLYKYVTNFLEDKIAVPFKVYKKFSFHDRMDITNILYNQTCTKLICSMTNASIFILPVAAEG